LTELAPVVLNCRAQLARKRKAAIAKHCRAAAAAGIVGPDGKHGFEPETLLVPALFALDVWHKTLADSSVELSLGSKSGVNFAASPASHECKKR